jgi:hypothetical protein
MAEPKIYSKNYVNADCTFSESHTGGTITRLYDRDPASQCVTSGANSDATEASIEVTFKEGATAVDRTFDRVILLGHNLKYVYLDYWNGSSWVNITSNSAVTGDIIFTFVAVTGAKFRIRATLTQTTNEEKKIGELIVCKLTSDVGIELESYEVTWRQKSTEVELADGSFHRAVVAHSVNRTSKYEARARFNFVPTATLTILRTLRESGAAFLWHPESESRPDQIFYVHWTGTERVRYASQYKGAGHAVEMELREV